ncbi:uncharacterized protein Fhos isoform X1 [Helicoverpa armigera]|uniref:uncharacterized protein Fhos isoform X1 n=1 Tax=Helicoverpa armigera TaxID=29058 RepID=UPI003082B3E2
MSFRNYYDTPSYGRSRDTGRTSSSTAADRPTTVTAKYLNTTPSYKSSSIPILCPERSAKEDTPISTIANRYANYGKTEKPTTKYDAYNTTKVEKSPNKYDSYSSSKSDKSANKYDTYNSNKADKPSSKYDAYSSSKTEKPVSKYDAYSTTKTEKPISKYEKKDYSKLTVPSITTNKSRDVSPVSTSKYSLSRPSRHLSPERRATKTFKDKSRDPSPGDHDKDIPSKTDKSTGYNSLSSYKLYPRTSNYTRPASRAETKPEITVNRYAIANRLSSNYLRSPPTVKRTSVSPVNHNETVKCEVDKCISQPATVEEIKPQNEPVSSNNEVLNTNDKQTEENENETETVSIVTRHTSPTPPGSSAYVRSRRADMAKTIEKSITRPKKRPEMIDKEIQSDRLDDPTRSSRFGSTARTSVTNWSYYTPNSNSYTGYAGRYSTQYSNIRDSSGSNSYSPSERTGRSQSTEPERRDNSNCNSLSESNNIDCNVSNHIGENDQEVVSVYASEQNKGDDTSEIIINVNLKLKRAKSPVASTELVSPEITITNSQLPPQAPKPDGATKTKKIKVKKTSADSSSDSSGKKKIIKRRSKSVSSTDSDQGSEVSDKGSPPKSMQKNSSSSNLQNGPSKLKHSKSRESASPESSITLSTQSSISEDETVSKSKTNEVSRTSADELSIPTDRSGKQPSPLPPQKNETGTEEAKSFLIRALAPVTNLFKMRHQESSDNSRWLETSTSESTGKDVSNITTESERLSKGKNDTTNIIASNDDNLVKLKSIRPIESGERAWWLDSESKNSTQNNSEHTRSPSEKNIPRKIRHVESGEKAWWLESNSESKQDNQMVRNNTTESSDSNRLPKKCKFADDEKPWWLDSCANIPEGVERLSPPRKSSSDSEKSEKFNFFKVRHNESGDQKDWWLTSNENSTNSSKPEHNQMLSKSGSERSFPLRRIRHIESGERPWWLASDKNIPEGIEKLPTPPPPPEESDSSDSEVQAYVPPAHIPPFPLHLPDDEPLGTRRSPEGLETPRENEDYRGRTSPYENSNHQFRRPSTNSYQKGVNKYISRYTDIDDILGTSGQIYSPFMDSILARRTGQMPYDDNDTCEEIDPTQVRIHDSTAQRPVIKKIRSRSSIVDYREEDQLDDATLQVFKDGDYGPYLDLDSTLGEQDEELEGLQDSRKNALVLRTQLSVRVHAIIERLLHSQGRELRRALFTLKQILQSDKDLVHEFVANKGLDCLMQVGNMADHNYLDYILRALGQILLYVDGMHGVMAHKRCIQWLYTLIASKFRHVVKTALKLLLVFVEYTEKNCLLLIDAIISVDNSNGRQPWHNIMKILQDFDASDTELLIYATTLINRCLNNVPDRDTYYDQVDALQDQGIDDIIQLYMSKQGTDLDLLRQLQIFEAVLLYEDGDETGTALKQLDDSVINSIRRRSINLSTERRKSKKQQCKEKAKPVITHTETENKITNNHRTQFLPSITDHNKENKELSSALRRRRDRYARQAHHIIQQQELMNHSSDIYNGLFPNPNESFTSTNGSFTSTNGNYYTPNGTLNNANGSFTSPNGSFTSLNGTFTSVNGSFSSGNVSFPSLIGNYTNTNGSFSSTISNYTNGSYTNNKSYTAVNGNINGSSQLNGANGQKEEDDKYVTRTTKNFNLADVLKNGSQRYTSGLKQRIQNGTLGHTVNAVDAITVMRQKQTDPTPEVKDDRGFLLNREHSIKDLAQRLTSPVSPTTEEKPLRVSDMAGIVSKAKEELAKSQSKEIIKSPTIEKSPKVHEIKVSENDLHWEELRKGCLHREFHLCDLDFSDLREDSDDEMSSPAITAASGPPPPPPTMFPPMGIPPPLPGCFPMLSKNNIPNPPKPALSSEMSNDSDSSTIKKNKKTVKLFWKEIQENPTPVAIRPKVGGFIWDDLPNVTVDTNMLEHLFESRTNDLIIKVSTNHDLTVA